MNSIPLFGSISRRKWKDNSLIWKLSIRDKIAKSEHSFFPFSFKLNFYSFQNWKELEENTYIFIP